MRDILAPRELARLCGVSPDTIRGWCIRKQIKFASTPGGHKRFQKQDVLEFLKAHGFPLPQTGKLPNIRILVADDNKIHRRRLVDPLQKEAAFNVKEAADGYEAGRMIGEFEPDVLILDPGTPDIDCSKICQDIQARAKVGQKKMVIVIGRSGEAGSQEAFNIGADVCLTKPVDVELMIELIYRQCQRAGERTTRDKG